jgi:Transposase DDE domain
LCYEAQPHTMKGTRMSLVAKIQAFGPQGQVKQRILLTLLPLFIGMYRRMNFRQIAFASGYCERTILNWFSHKLDLLPFNVNLINEHTSGKHIFIFDPSFLTKSGKLSAYVGKFWSGSARKVQWGQEIGCLSLGDLIQRTAYHLQAKLTPNKQALEASSLNLMSHYVKFLLDTLPFVIGLSNVLACDGYFGVSTFVKPIMKLNIHIISKIKSNGKLFYKHVYPKDADGKIMYTRGRPKIKGDRIDWKKINDDLLPIVKQDLESIVRSAVVYSTNLNMLIRIVVVDYLKSDGTLGKRVIQFSTDPNSTWEFILEAYGLRFQIEFNFRDSKQFTGLAHCQSRDLIRIENHINLSLTATSIAKMTHWLNNNQNPETPFSMAEIKNYYYNLMLTEKIFKALGQDPEEILSNEKIISILESTSYKTKAA